MCVMCDIHCHIPLQIDIQYDTQYLYMRLCCINIDMLLSRLPSHMYTITHTHKYTCENVYLSYPGFLHMCMVTIHTHKYICKLVHIHKHLSCSSLLSRLTSASSRGAPPAWSCTWVYVRVYTHVYMVHMPLEAQSCTLVYMCVCINTWYICIVLRFAVSIFLQGCVCICIVFLSVHVCVYIYIYTVCLCMSYIQGVYVWHVPGMLLNSSRYTRIYASILCVSCVYFIFIPRGVITSKSPPLDNTHCRVNAHTKSPHSMCCPHIKSPGSQSGRQSWFHNTPKHECAIVDDIAWQQHPSLDKRLTCLH